MIDIQINSQQLRQIERQLAGIPNALTRIMPRALNRTAEQARTRMVRYVSTISKMKQKTVRSYHYLKRCQYNPRLTYTALDWRATIDISKFRQSLILLHPRQVKAGVKYRTILGEYKIREHAFIATGMTRGKEVWLRSIYELGYRKYYQEGPKREALYPQKGESIQEFWLEHLPKLNEIANESRQRLQKNIHDQIQLILSRRAR